VGDAGDDAERDQGRRERMGAAAARRVRRRAAFRQRAVDAGEGDREAVGRDAGGMGQLFDARATIDRPAA
jgi:hypothetical protein